MLETLYGVGNASAGWSGTELGGVDLEQALARGVPRPCGGFLSRGSNGFPLAEILSSASSAQDRTEKPFS